MPPRKDSSVFSFDELPNIDYDIDSKQASDLTQINDEDIIKSQTLCSICANKGENKEENEENDTVLGLCTLLEKHNANFERNKFLSELRKNQFSAAISIYRSLISKVNVGTIGSIDIRENIQKISDLFSKCFQTLYDSAYFSLIEHCEKNITKRFKGIDQLISEQSIKDEEYEVFFANFQKEKKNFAAVLEVMRTQLTLTQLNSSLKFLRKREKSLNEIISLLSEKYGYECDERLMKWMKQEILSTLDFKAMVIGNKVAEMIANELSSSESEEDNEQEKEKEKETKKPKSEKDPKLQRSKTPTSEENEKESSSSSEAEYGEQEEESEDQQNDDFEEEEDDETKDEDNQEQYDSERSKDMKRSGSADADEKEAIDPTSAKQSTKQKKLEKLKQLIDPILSLDCESESPVLAAFWISKLCDMKHVSHEVIVQSFQSIFTEMRHFLDNLDMTYPATCFFNDTEELFILNASLQTRLGLGRLTEFEPLINELHSFYMTCRMINASTKTISKLFYAFECSRRISSIIKTAEINDPTLSRACETFARMRKTLVPIIQISHAIEGLNEYAFEQGMQIERLELHIPSSISLDVLPYSAFVQHPLNVNKDYAKYLSDLAHKIEESGIQIINPKAKGKPFSVDQLIVPSLSEMLAKTSQIIENCVPQESHLFEFAKRMKTCMVDGRNLIDVIKEFTEFSAKAEVNKQSNEDFEEAIKYLKDIFRVHQLFISLEIGGLISYSNALHYTYLRVYSKFISTDTVLESQSLLAPVSYQLLIDVQHLTQSKLQSNMLQQRISLLNRMKMVFGDLIAVAFTKEDGTEYNNISQWVDIIMQLCQMTDVDGVQQIKPLCINLPKLPDFPQLAEDLWHLVESPPLTEQESRAIEHMQTIYSTEFNGEDVTTNFNELGKFGFIAMTKDYTELLRKAKDYGFTSVADDYELGQYGDSYANRFIEHHWKINLCQTDDFAEEVFETLPPLSPQTEALHNIFAVVKNGGLTLENVIKFGKIALKLRSLFTNGPMFTCLYRKLHTLISYLEHHDALAELTGQIANSGLIAFSFLRTFNYLRFVKYITGLALKLNSASAFHSSEASKIFSQCLRLRSYATTIKQITKLNDEACEKLQQLINCIIELFEKNSFNFDTLFAKAKLNLKTFASQNNEPELVLGLSKLFSSYQAIATQANAVEMYKIIEPMKKLVYNSKYINDNFIVSFMNAIETLFSIAQLRSCIDPTNNFIENSGMNYFNFSNPFELSNIKTVSHKGAPKFHAFTIPRPRITVPSTTLTKPQQEQIVSIFEQFQKEREESLEKMQAYNEAIDEKDKQIKMFKEIYAKRHSLVESFNTLKEGITPLVEEDELQTSPALAAGEEARPKNTNKVELRGKLAAEYENRALIAGIFDNSVIESTNELREKASALSGMKDETSPILGRMMQNAKNESEKNEQNAPEPQVSKCGVDFEGIDKQLLPILKICGINPQ